MCEKCGENPNHLVVTKDTNDKVWLVCSTCYVLIKPQPTRFGQASMIATDSIPGGYYVKHGLCNPDGSPKRFDSKSDIKEAAYESGWTIGGETPKINPRIQDAKKLQDERRESGIPQLRSR